MIDRIADSEFVSWSVLAGRPGRASVPAPDVQRFRAALSAAYAERDDAGRIWADARWGIYAFYDYDGEPIYVGQTREMLRVRVNRHLTNQRTDAVAMRILDVFEVAEMEIWPLWDLADVARKDPVGAQRRLDAYEYTAYLSAIEHSRYKAILNEKIPPVAPLVTLPPSLRWMLIDTETRIDRGHPDVRIARRAETISRLAAVARERGEVSEGLRRVLVVQAVRLAHLAAERLAWVEGRRPPEASAIDTKALVGEVRYEYAEPLFDLTDEEVEDGLW